MDDKQDKPSKYSCCICLTDYDDIQIEQAPKKRCKKSENFLKKSGGNDRQSTCDSDIESGNSHEKKRVSSSLFLTDDNIDKDLPNVLTISSTATTDDLGVDNDDEKEGFSHNQRRSFYQLESCQHLFCTFCLASYCASKVKDGHIKIQCGSPIRDFDDKSGLRSTSTSSPQEASSCCTELITENDIIFLLDYYDKVQSKIIKQSVWFTTINPSSSRLTMLERYNRFKFDSEHKENARRCPKCEHPHIFEMIKDEDSSNKIQSVHIESDRDEIVPKRWSGISRFFYKKETKKNSTSNTGTLDEAENLEKGNEENESKYPQRFCIVIPRSGKDGVENQSEPDNNTRIKEDATVSEQDKESDGPKNDESDVNLSLRSQTEMTSIKNIGSPQQTTQSSDYNRKRPSVPVVKCVECDSEFCFFHSNAHVGQTCEQYEERIKEEEKKVTIYLETIGTKQCPSCGAHIERDGGCNHVKCGHCGTCFCWLCLTIVDDSTFPSHFQWWNLRGCPNLQLHEGEDPSQFIIFGSKILSMFQVIIIGPPAVCLAAITAVLCCCCIPGATIKERIANCISFWGNTIILILILLAIFCLSSFLVVPCLIALVLHILLLCCRNGERNNIPNNT